jgi:hypothetical protein
MGGRLYTQREWRLLSWWLATFHPNAEIWMNLRVGPTSPILGVSLMTPAMQALSRVRNRWVDALFLEGGELNLVEAKLQPDPGIFSQLIHYARKLRMDPTWEAYASTPLNLIALVYHDDASVAQEAPWYGVRWVVYQPALDHFVPPQLQGSEAGSIGANLPQDWASRVSWLTGKPLAIV